MSKVEFSSLEYDLLTELINVAMGVSASELADLFDNFVNLKVPTLMIETSENLPETLISNSLFSEEEVVTIVRQQFDNDNALKGVGIIILNDQTKKSILPLLELKEEDLLSAEFEDFLLELCSQLIGSCIRNLLKQFFENPTRFKSPHILKGKDSLRKSCYRTVEEEFYQFGDVLCSKIEFNIQDVNFHCDLFFLIDSSSLQTLHELLQKIIKES